MRLAKTAGFVLLAAHLEVWVACSGWRPQRSPDDPVVEYRVSQPDARGRTEYMLTIDRGGQVLVQPPLPSPPGSKTLHTQLTCAERAELPDVMKREIAKLRPVYGLDEDRTGNQGSVSVLYRGKWMEKRVVWRNPPSKPEPPGGWYHITGMLDDIKRRAEETNEAKNRAAGNFMVYGKSSSGKVGTYHYSLSINQSGSAVVMGGLGAASYRRRGQTQLTAEELATLLRTIQEAKIADFQQCYGRHAEVNEQSVSLTYRWDGNEKDVLWMSPPDDPKPPQGWFKIVEILDQIWTRAEKRSPSTVSSNDGAQPTIREALLSITAGKLNPTPLSVTYDDMHGLWGGLTLTIQGDGHVEQNAVKQEVAKPTMVSRDSILKLVSLLLQEEAWEQREPQRVPKPDESKAKLIIRYGTERSEIREWFNDLEKNHRLEKIRGQMKSIASQ